MTADTDPTDDLGERVARSVAVIRERIGARRPRVAVVLGSGWGPFIDAVEDAVDLPYADLPAFPVLGIGGHVGRLRVGRVGHAEVMVLAGRKHAYETGDASAMKGVIRTLAAFGIGTLVQSNAAGSLDAAMPAGSLMLISDHLNLVQRSPLFGERGDARFVGMTDAYAPELRSRARAAAAVNGIELYDGVYAWMMGPQFETPAEIRMLQLLGARAVGMSTVPETILARHAGLQVLAVSLVTNLGAGLSEEVLSHEHTLRMAADGAARAVRLMSVLVQALAAPTDQRQPAG